MLLLAIIIFGVFSGACGAAQTINQLWVAIFSKPAIEILTTSAESSSEPFKGSVEREIIPCQLSY